MSVEVQPTGAVVVRAPKRLPLAAIDAFVHSRAGWIAERLLDLEARRSLVPQRTHARAFHHRGNVLTWGWEGADVIVPTRCEGVASAQRWVTRWQRREAEVLFAQIIADHLPSIGVPALRYQGLTIRRMRRRWGSCSSTGTITLNEHLIRVPDACIRSVIVHEICHLVHMHHGPDFHHLVRDVYPDHAIADAMLDAWTSVLYDEPGDQAEAFEQISSNAFVSEAAIISGERPSM
jgi:predicted metal-dependent hydrolase